MAEVRTDVPVTETQKTKVIDFEAAKARLPDNREDHQTRRALQPPRSRTEREMWHTATRLHTVREALAAEQGQTAETQEQDSPRPDNTIDFGGVRDRVEKRWAFDFVKEVYYSPRPQPTEAEWGRFARIDPSTESLAKWGVTLTNRIHEIEGQAGGDKEKFDALWQKELSSLHAEGEKQKTAEWAKAGITRLPDEEWAAKIREGRAAERQADDERFSTLYGMKPEEFGREQREKFIETHVANLPPKEREALLQRRKRAEEHTSGKVVSSREEIDKRLKTENLPPISDAQYSRLMEEDAYREALTQGLEVSQPLYEKEVAKRKAEYLKREAMSPEERERQDQQDRVENYRLQHIKDIASFTPEEWEKEQQERQEFHSIMRQRLTAMHAEKRKREAYIHSGDSRYDPLTGELLQPDELPLDQEASYLLNGKTRPRRFLPSDSPHLKEAKQLEENGEAQVPESPYHQRLIQRLQKAGFVEVAPTLNDTQFFAYVERFRHMSPTEIIQEWQQTQKDMKERVGFKEDTLGETFAKFIASIAQVLAAIASPSSEPEEGTENSTKKTA